MRTRDKIQDELVEWLLGWTTASYGVQAGKRLNERTIFFGMADRTLDAKLYILENGKLYLDSTRGDHLGFSSVDEFKKFCIDNYGAPINE